ncbi:MAG: DUF2232 domain-containing protein [Gemmatimonadota bacterium]
MGPLLLALAYLFLAPPAFLLGPLAGLLALSQPSTVREWAWLAVATIWLGAWLQPAGDVVEQLLRAAGVLVAGGFVAVSLGWRAPPFRRAVVAVGLASLALVVWCVTLRLDWHELRMALARDVVRSFEDLAKQADAAGGGDTGQLLRQMADRAPMWAALTPALLFLNALAGVLLGWSLYHRIAARPLGDPPAPFAAFRFSDQAVWLPVVALALVLLPAPPPVRDAGANLLLVAVTLYAARGLAVVGAGAGRLPRVTTAFVTVVALFLLPFVLGGLTLLGLADTWLDFRRRPASPATGGFNR